MPIRRYRITGRVQGVFFRGWTVEKARALGVDGWVRNRSDGSVEVLASGDEDVLERLRDRLQQGPPHARVDHVEVSDGDEPVPAGFGQRPTL